MDIEAQNIIKVRVKNVYGVDKVYPDCERSTLLAMIAGTKTLTPDVVRLIGRLGFDLIVVGQDLPRA